MSATHLTLTFAALCGFASAAVRSGKAEADWFSASSTYEPGKPVQTAIRLRIDPGWHSYWLNPGEGGMKTSVKWELPIGWTAGELENPIPKRFQGGGLAGFGYDATVIFPVKLNPPKDVKGTVTLKAKISWLTCDEQTCVPGNAELSITLESGVTQMTPETKLIEQALTKIPREQKEWGPLEVIEKAGQLEFRIPVQGNKSLNLDESDIFPATPEVIDANHRITLKPDGTAWTGVAPKSDYVKAKIRELFLVIDPKSGQQPILLHWKID
jgi:DsbC/DsbD-like thiol-disulfide interchange protein